MNRLQSLVADFNAATNTPRGSTPEFRAAELRARLILEEALETVEAMLGFESAERLLVEQKNRWLDKPDESTIDQPNMVEAVDGLCDLLYVTLGAFDAFGIDAEPFFNIVHEANMTKLSGPKDEHGKQLKPPGFVPPQQQIRELILKMGAKL